ncbi:hypothetical protein B0T11DRAFT_273973 [Plectosphaerella cucumerina]|uniref:Uncharacterized protein n=1 Tax=Plectosphaerella cucumerina TaxID=40658 RepID=A0A8K0TKB8_9PEZI|nr:hypothetical protein B0T11DRAFT_273973 [Plectosphaerella cucumerina]
MAHTTSTCRPAASTVSIATAGCSQHPPGGRQECYTASRWDTHPSSRQHFSSSSTSREAYHGNEVLAGKQNVFREQPSMKVVELPRQAPRRLAAWARRHVLSSTDNLKYLQIDMNCTNKSKSTHPFLRGMQTSHEGRPRHLQLQQVQQGR